MGYRRGFLSPETHPLRPINSYGIVKSSIEHYLDLYRRARGLSPVIIRASNPFGPRQAHSGVQGVISTFLRRILSGDHIEIWGDGTIVRDYLDVGDLAEICVRAGTSDREGAYNAGSGYGLSINEIVQAIRKVTGLDFKTVYKPGARSTFPARFWTARAPKKTSVGNAKSHLFRAAENLGLVEKSELNEARLLRWPRAGTSQIRPRCDHPS